MRLRRATGADLDTVVALTRDGRAYLAAQGLDQWQGGNPTPQRIAEDIAQGFSRLAVDEDGDVPLGTLAICTQGETDYDNVRQGAWLTDSPNSSSEGNVTYAALHRVAVSSAARRRGVASFMVEQACQIARHQGFLSVRVDTHEGNLPMQGMLLSNGFVRCCEIEIANPLEFTKKRIGFELLL